MLICLSNKPSPVSIMVCSLLGARPLSMQMLACRALCRKQESTELDSKYNNFDV